jgi:acylphosphatase
MKEKEAISGTVTGNDQHVGFRAMIMKQAIEYNLAGFAKNLPNDVVNFTLQGDAKRLPHALSAIQEGTKKSSHIKVSTTQGTVDPALNLSQSTPGRRRPETSPTRTILSSICGPTMESSRRRMSRPHGTVFCDRL